MFTGVGFVFVKDGGIVGVDIDHCLDPATGEPNETAADILAMIPPTYIEVSPSGTGLHIFLKGAMPEGGCKNTKTAVEMYAHSRYFTMTGKSYQGSVDTIAEDNGVLKKIHDKYIRVQRKQATKKRSKQVGAPLSDEELLEKARQSGAGENLALRWDGKWQELFQSQSEADLSLCCKLAFWSGKNREQMDRLFRQSALMRPKWDERHKADGATYGEETLCKAAEATENVYSPGSDDPVFQFDGRYFRAKDDKIYPITNFIIKPVEMLVGEDETQLTADLVTTGGETFRQIFMTSDFSKKAKR
jgi:primase-polymerase (primpol)-like protein